MNRKRNYTDQEKHVGAPSPSINWSEAVWAVLLVQQGVISIFLKCWASFESLVIRYHWRQQTTPGGFSQLH